MLHRERLKPPPYVYPTDEWKIIEKRFYPKFLPQMESLFALSNGYLGMRGTFDEGAPVVEPGVFVNGFHETWPIVYGEEAYGFAKTGQTMVNVPDGTVIRLYVDDEPFYIPTANLAHFERTLDMQRGVLERDILWETPVGKQVAIRSRRFVSFPDRHIAAISYEVTVLNAEAPVVISSQILARESVVSESEDPRGTRRFAWKVLMPQVHTATGERLVFGMQARNSHMTLACGAEHQVVSEAPHSLKTFCKRDSGSVVLSVAAQPGVPIRLTKYLTYHTSRSAPTEELCRRARRTLDRAQDSGFEALLARHQEYLRDAWQRSDVQVQAEPTHARASTEEFQQAMRLNVFHLLQATGRAEGVGVPAKGLTGQGYEGQYFWDTEVYVIPFLIYTAPRIARNLLKFRHSMLDKARQRAREVNQKGALYPWRTINGDEASAYYAAGTAQYHLNADIMYALRKYVQVTGDREFLVGEGVEMLVETARLWLDLGFYSQARGGKFCIQGVTGPDEYNTVVDNNLFTNLMARENLWYAAESVEWIRDQRPERYRVLVQEIGLGDAEATAWRQAADAMYLPYDGKLRIHLQDDGFLNKEEWDFANTPEDNYPLLLHYHPLVIYRHRVIKQADVVLAMFLLGDHFSSEQKKRNFDFYDALTTGDSSLSVGIQCVLAHEIGYVDKALEYGRYAVLMDLADIHGNVNHGVHVASMGATWMVMTYGFAGMRDYGGNISFDPKLPPTIRQIRFFLKVRGSHMEVRIDTKEVTYKLLQGELLALQHRGEPLTLSPENPAITRPARSPQEK